MSAATPTLPRERRTPEAPMTDHLLPVTTEQLARLPDGVLLGFDGFGAAGRLRRGDDGALRICPLDGGRLSPPVDGDDLRLVLDDVLTRAAVAALVMPSTRGPHDSVRDAAGHDACAAAVWWPTWFGSARITPEEVTGHVARVARAAWGGEDSAPASRSPADASTEHALVSLQARAVRP